MYDPDLTKLRDRLDQPAKPRNIDPVPALERPDPYGLHKLVDQITDARTALAAGDLTAYNRAAKAAERLKDETAKILGGLPDDLYRAQRNKVAAEDHNLK